jgi:hypothetical protein
VTAVKPQTIMNNVCSNILQKWEMIKKGNSINRDVDEETIRVGLWLEVK